MPEPTHNATSGIPKAVHDAAKAAGGDVVQLGGTPRGRHLAETLQPAETAAKAVMARAIESSGSGAEALETIQQTAADLVRGAGDVDANIIGTVKGAVESGAVEGGRRTGIGGQDAAEAAAIGAIEGAGDLGEGAVEHVKKLVTGPIGTVTPLSESTFAKGRRTP